MDERKCAVRTSPSFCFLTAPSFMPRPTAVLHWAALGHQISTPSFYTLVAHLLQQIVDERASQHVEETASSYSIDV